MPLQEANNGEPRAAPEQKAGLVAEAGAKEPGSEARVAESDLLTHQTKPEAMPLVC